MERMDQYTKKKLLEIRVKSKLHGNISEEEFKFAQQCYAKYPKEYAALDDEINEITTEYVNPKLR
jgi:hypothetical protein